VSFNSLQYAAFLAVVLLGYHRLGRRAQNLVMLVAGAVFVAWFDVRFLAAVAVTIALGYAVTRLLAVTESEPRRRALLAVALVGHLGVLGFVKYAGFFLDSADRVLEAVGFEDTFGTLDVLLPVGISFYTLQALGYVINVYRREVAVEEDLLTFAVFVLWFPQLVAGPIERARTLLPQLRERRPVPDADTVGSALLLVLTGLFKKVVVADGVAAYVSGVYATPDAFGWVALLTATTGFAVQVYADFSGYTDIARGSSRLLGVELRRNFEQPFLSRDIRELWTRWHTSLSGWFVEFVGRPLGATGRGPRRAAVAVLVIFALIGLWHGSAAHFVAWGVLNGVLVVVWRLWFPVPARRHPMRVRLREAPAIGLTFVLFCLGVVFFRADSLGDAFDVLARMLTFEGTAKGPAGAPLVPLMLLVVLALDLDERRRRVRAIESLRIRAALGAVPTPPEAIRESGVDRMTVARCVAVGLMVVGIVLFSGGEPTPFIYRQF
jgi:D-alanyl-lipoteichoic acid acyltransferase DltB (MBOAT superfamily)